jgi:hypothetical protein
LNLQENCGNKCSRKQQQRNKTKKQNEKLKPIQKYLKDNQNNVTKHHQQKEKQHYSAMAIKTS